MMVTLTSRDPE